MSSRSSRIWIVLGVLAAIVFADEIFSLLGTVIGVLFSIGITGLLILGLAIGAFALALFIGCSVGVALIIASVALVFSLFGWLLPYLLVGFLVYLLVRKKPNTV